MKPSLPPRKPRTPLPSRTTPIARSGIKRSGKPIRKVGKSKAKRRARNAAYYRSAEWRDVKKRTHEHDGYRCRKIETMSARDYHDRINAGLPTWYPISGTHSAQHGIYYLRCPNMGEVVNGKQTARGLVCDEISYGRRGDGTKGSGTHEVGVTTRSLCKACNAMETTSKRANWMR